MNEKFFYIDSADHGRMELEQIQEMANRLAVLNVRRTRPSRNLEGAGRAPEDPKESGQKRNPAFYTNSGWTIIHLDRIVQIVGIYLSDNRSPASAYTAVGIGTLRIRVPTPLSQIQEHLVVSSEYLEPLILSDTIPNSVNNSASRLVPASILF